MNKKYIFFDIDGTLAAGGYEHTYIPESAKLALEKLREAGHFLSIATGRAHCMALSFMENLGFDNMVSDGGYGLTINKKLLGIRPLPKDKIVTLVNECEEKNIPWGIQVDDSHFRLTPDDRFSEASNDKYMKTKVVPGLRPENYENIYKMYIAGTYPLEKNLTHLDALPWYRFHKEYLFVEPADKAYGIRKMMDYFKADYKDAVVFGDSGNDLSMFVDDWTKVAMGNAIPELKEKADYVTTDVDKDGIYNACKALNLF